MHPTRLTALAAAALAAALGAGLVTGGTTAQAGAVRTEAGTDLPLRELADRVRLPVGTAVDMQALADDSRYRRTVAREFSSVTAENVMKWEALEPTRGDYTYDRADRLVRFAAAHDQQVRGHVLVWHNQNPTWLTEGDFTPEQLRRILRRHITETVSHFAGQVYEWDVVNEALDDDGSLRDTFWLRELGPGYIADAFRWAHAADPQARLFYNDYSIEDVNPKSDALYRLVRRLQRQGVPIDGVGFQGHQSATYAPTSMRANLDRFERLGLATAVTEADVRIELPAGDAKLQAQANVYATMLDACLQARRCTSFTVWGYTDRYSWVPGVFEGEGAATLLDRQFRPKPAYRAAQRVLLAAP